MESTIKDEDNPSNLRFVSLRSRLSFLLSLPLLTGLAVKLALRRDLEFDMFRALQRHNLQRVELLIDLKPELAARNRSIKGMPVDVFAVHTEFYAAASDINAAAGNQGTTKLSLFRYATFNPPSNNRTDFLKSLVSQIDPSAALQSALDARSPEVVELLLAQGADPTVRLRDGMNAFQIAKHSRPLTARLLAHAREKGIYVDPDWLRPTKTTASSYPAIDQDP